MTDGQMDRFIARVSALGGQPYALMDAARGYRVEQAVRWSARPYQCLYAGALPAELARAAPYVVEMGGDHHFTRRVLREGWGESWGFFAVARGGSTLPAVRRHFRSLLRVRLESGAVVLFRYYDPRVLRVFLPTCSSTQLDLFFGPLASIIVEDADGGAPLAFHREAGAPLRIEKWT
jgi:hypothetical protein